jgi:hypothetical protein
MRITQENAGRVAAMLYAGGSLLASLAVFVAATIGGYDWVARLGSAGWVFVLSMIILMPTMMPLIAGRAARNAANSAPPQV